MSDVIAAIATAFGEAGVGIVRLSGEKAVDVAGVFFKALAKQTPREMILGNWICDGVAVDQVLCVRFESPASYTGEDLVEIHAHGGQFNLQTILKNLLDAGARLARPGEFTQRAFLHGKLDLTQAEAVADLISSGSELGRRAAAKQLQGGLFEKIEDWRLRIMDLSAASEAAVDFPDEADQIAPRREQRMHVEKLLEEIRRSLSLARTGRVLRDGLRVSIVGKPNVGKSSLMNALLDENRAIVSEHEGTTRDYLEERIQVQGFPIVLVDTAGLRESRDTVEVEGVRRSMQQMKDADFRLLVLDQSKDLQLEDEKLLETVASPRLVVANKGDLEKAWVSVEGEKVVHVSSKTKIGIEALLESILKDVVSEDLDSLVDQNLLTRERHRNALQKTEIFLSHAEETLKQSHFGPEFVAGDLRSALDALGEIVGKTTRAEVLNLIFSKFCIGK